MSDLDKEELIATRKLHGLDDDLFKEKRMVRKCSMCGEVKEESEFRYMKKQDRCNCYCKHCERLYNKEYQRGYRERKKEENNDNSKSR